MKAIKPYFKLIPEIYFLISVLFYWASASTLLNPVAITLLLIFILQLIFQNKISGVTIAVLFTLINLYMVLALLSEFHEFPTFSSEARMLLGVGLLYFGLNIAMSVIMGIKYMGGTPEKVAVTA